MTTSRAEAAALASVDLVATGIRARAAMADIQIGYAMINGRVQAITLHRLLSEHAIRPADVSNMLAAITSAYDAEMGAEWKRCFDPWIPAREPRRAWRQWTEAAFWTTWIVVVLNGVVLAAVSFLR